jgi:hypothetical protein
VHGPERVKLRAWHAWLIPEISDEGLVAYILSTNRKFSKRDEIAAYLEIMDSWYQAIYEYSFHLTAPGAPKYM